MQATGSVPSPQLLTLFHAFSTALHRETSLPELLQSLVMRSVQLIPQAAAGCFIAYDGKTHTFEIQYSHGYAFPAMLSEISFSGEMSRLAEVVQTHTHILFKNELQISWLPEAFHSTYKEANDGQIPKESIAITVQSPHQLLGVLVIERLEGEEFQQSDAELIGNFTRQATLAIHKVELYQENLRITKALDEELSSVGRVQKDLLPTEHPNIPKMEWFTYYKPATRAGGDFYDFIPLPNGKWAVLMADVTGHGAPAAVIAAMIKVILHNLLETMTDPNAILQEANRQIRKHIESQYFVTLFLGMIDPATAKMDYVSAGHEPPMLFEYASQTIRELKNQKGFPLRLIEENTFDIKSIQFQAGDLLLIYTDGITELFNENGELFSFTGLENAIMTSDHTSAEAMGNQILSKLEAYRGSAEIHDDITLIALRVNG